MATVGEIVEFLDRFAPRSLAEDWDNVGLLVGDRGRPADRVMTCLTVTPATAHEAIERRAALVVTHHPVLFRPVQRLTADDVQGTMLLGLIRAGVAIYSPHTAFDSTVGGINELLAQRLHLAGTRPLRPANGAGRVKIVVFVPPGDLERVSGAMFDAGAGVIGEYRECSFRIAGRGTFFGSNASQPAVGRAGRREEVDEIRLEVVCALGHVPGVVAALRGAHSYEEPAFDLYPLQVEPSAAGAGRCGDLPAPLPLSEFAARVRAELKSGRMQVVGAADRRITRVAVACGAGSEFLDDAAAAGCDVLLTGEASFHRELHAEALQIAMVLAGHFATERIGVEALSARLSAAFGAVEIWASCAERDPAWTA